MIKCNFVIKFFRKPQYKSLKIIELIGRLLVFNDLFYHKYSKYRCFKYVLSHILFPQIYIYIYIYIYIIEKLRQDDMFNKEETSSTKGDCGAIVMVHTTDCVRTRVRR